MVTTIKQGSSISVINALLAKLFESKKVKGLNAREFQGKIMLDQSALSIQRQLRDEWE